MTKITHAKGGCQWLAAGSLDVHMLVIESVCLRACKLVSTTTEFPYWVVLVTAAAATAETLRIMHDHRTLLHRSACVTAALMLLKTFCLAVLLLLLLLLLLQC
jgi:hypothetical protein